MLTKKQEQFAREFVKNGGDRKAAYKAAYGKKITDASASNGASRMMKNDEVKMMIHHLERKADAKVAAAAGKRRAEEIEETARADDAAADIRAELIAFYRSMMNGEIYDSTTMWDDKAEKWIEVKRVAKASDRANAAEKLAAFYGVTPEPNEAIRIELIGGAEGLAD